ncbi:hypothetical protein JYK02_28735 [Corallococcus macrosporus]|uniref:Uncharacterized protein n=1 Tax=Corallococcus macrosporus TaxID=35 RepID=A0ABS3DJL6_9BACT|nr:hypothetical protein [Corallococcus macrosporus]MBN8231506.1 hypothetical protein [Corallococcus macrosporus]
MSIRYGLVELYVEIPERRFQSLSDALVRTIQRQSEKRLSDVLKILRAPETQRLDLIEFPGWTLVGEKVPEEVIAASGGRTVVLEMLPTEQSDSASGKRGVKGGAFKDEGARSPITWRTHVIHKGGVLGPVVQMLVTSGDAGKRNAPTEKMREFKSALSSGARSWETRASLWVCGEVNALYGNGDEIEPRVPDLPLDWRLIANPSHRPSKLPAMQAKRAYLSSKGLLLMTANTHSQWRDASGTSRHGGYVAAQVFHKGRRLGREELSATSIGAHRLLTAAS